MRLFLFFYIKRSEKFLDLNLTSGCMLNSVKVEKRYLV